MTEDTYQAALDTIGKFMANMQKRNEELTREVERLLKENEQLKEQ